MIFYFRLFDFFFSEFSNSDFQSLKIPVFGLLQITDFHRTQEVIKHTIWVAHHAFQIKLVLETGFLKQELLVGENDYWFCVSIQACKQLRYHFFV